MSIVQTKETCDGAPRIDGHRITVSNIQGRWQPVMNIAGRVIEQQREPEVRTVLFVVSMHKKPLKVVNSMPIFKENEKYYLAFEQAIDFDTLRRSIFIYNCHVYNSLIAAEAAAVRKE